MTGLKSKSSKHAFKARQSAKGLPEGDGHSAGATGACGERCEMQSFLGREDRCEYLV